MRAQLGGQVSRLAARWRAMSGTARDPSDVQRYACFFFLAGVAGTGSKACSAPWAIFLAKLSLDTARASVTAPVSSASAA